MQRLVVVRQNNTGDQLELQSLLNDGYKVVNMMPLPGYGFGYGSASWKDFPGEIHYILNKYEV